MRRHARETFAGSNSHRSGGLDRIFRGASVIRGFSLRGSGSGAPKASRAALPAVVLAAIVGTLALLVALASAAAPVVVTGSASNVQKTTATLNGTVNPEGTVLEECFFEYGKDLAYGQTVPCAESPAAIGAGASPVVVHADLSGLEFGAEYHFRLFTKNEETGLIRGDDQTFRTLGPVIRSVGASPVGTTTAKLNASLNPNGKPTTYHFEYTDDADFQANGFVNATKKPVTDAFIGAGSIDVGVSTSLSGLQPATTYHLRIAATNPDGTSYADAVFATYAPLPAFGSCGNDVFRLGHPSAKLPDCRAYEQATPIDKNGNDVAGVRQRVQASISGDGITSLTKGGLPGGEGAQTYPPFLSRRAPTNWSTQGLLPPSTYAPNIEVLAWTPDLNYSFAIAKRTDTGFFTNALLMRSSANHAVRQITPYTRRALYGFAGASADGSRVFFEAAGEGVAFTDDAAVGPDNLYLYEPATERLSLAGVLPAAEGGGAPAEGSFAGSGESPNDTAFTQVNTEKQRAVSLDGDQVFFTDAGTHQIYLREGLASGSPQTIPVSASQRTTPDPNGTKPPEFQTATPSGSIGFFTSCEKLTDDSTAVSTPEETCGTSSQGGDLYAYDTSTGQLRDLTVDGSDPMGAQVQGVIGTSDDGSYVYFVANGDLDGSGSGAVGDCQSSGAGTCSIYVWHAGSTTFVARLAASTYDARNWTPYGEETVNTGRVSTDGHTMVFSSKLQQTPYDNSAGANCGTFVSVEGCPEFYRYNTSTGLTCVTCNPTGAAPTGDPSLGRIEIGVSNFFNHPLLYRFVSNSGNQVFFETPEKLVAADTNGDGGCPKVARPAFPVPTCMDVYEWEAPGAGTCAESSSAYSSQDGGCIYLISTGTSKDPSFFADASASGDDVFFYTSEQLVPQDQDTLVDVYDASVEGGLASQYASEPSGCEGEACRGSGTRPSGVQGAGSAVFSGPGSEAGSPRRDCGPAAKRAVALARASKNLRRRASAADDAALAKRLRTQSVTLAKHADALSRDARRCRRANRKAAR